MRIERKALLAGGVAALVLATTLSTVAAAGIGTTAAPRPEAVRAVASVRLSPQASVIASLSPRQLAGQRVI